MHPSRFSPETVEELLSVCFSFLMCLFAVPRINVWINPGQSWTPGQRRASWTAWSDSSTPASSSWTDWSRRRGAGAPSPRPWRTEKRPRKDVWTRASGAPWLRRFLAALQMWPNCPPHPPHRAVNRNAVAMLDASACDRPHYFSGPLWRCLCLFNCAVVKCFCRRGGGVWRWSCHLLWRTPSHAFVTKVEATVFYLKGQRCSGISTVHMQ